MATHRQPPPLRATGPGGGMPPPRKPYTWRGDGGRAAQVDAQLRALRAELTGPDDSFATPAEVFRERQLEDAEMPARLATSREARAAVRTPTVIKLRVVADPINVNGRRRPWVGPVPPGLAVRLAAVKRPEPLAIAPSRAAPRCRRCGYQRTRCTCPGRRT